MQNVTKYKLNYLSSEEPPNADEGMTLLAKLFVLFAEGISEYVENQKFCN